MIKSVKVTNYRGESLTMDMMFPEQSGFAIQKIDGLGPSKATINMTELATNDGALYNSARVGSRNIVLDVGFVSATSIETVRQLSYKYFPVKKPLTLTIETDNRTCEVVGYVESNDPVIFGKGASAQISILCPDSYLYSIDKTITIFSGVVSTFEFPFSNESTTLDLLNFGDVISDTLQTVVYEGDAETGIELFIHAIGTASMVNIFNLDTGESMKIDTVKLATLTGSGIIAGDDIIISTIKGAKSITLLRGGVYTNILNCLDKGGDWFTLTKGDNLFTYTATSGVSNLQFKIENRTLFEGV